MAFKYLILAVILGMCRSDKDDKKWVWNENSRSSNGRSSGVAFQNPKSRYNVFEETNDHGPQQHFPGRPQFIPNERPQPIYENLPPISASNLQKPPGGLYGGNLYSPTYGNQQSHYAPNENPGVLVGPTPSWVRDGPIKDFDKCKCAEKFNCNSPGISYGHCDVGKQYCCYSTKRSLGGPIPSKPVHSIENGVLVGPGGPVDRIPGGNGNLRPHQQPGAGFYGPGQFQVPQSGLSNNVYGNRPGEFREQNTHSLANGVLVGPGGPYDGPQFGLERSTKGNIKT